MLPIDLLVQDLSTMLDQAIREVVPADPTGSGVKPITWGPFPWEDDPAFRTSPQALGPADVRIDVRPRAAFTVVDEVDKMSNTRREQRIAEETFEQSPNFQSAQAATMPSRWMVEHQNGKIPVDKLKEVKGFGLYRPDAARALQAMARAARRDGVDLSGGGYRSYEAQAARYQEVPHLAAPPGKSNHGWGLAADLSDNSRGGLVAFDTEAYEWLAKNARRFGWMHPDWAQADGSKPEPWHWEYIGGYKGGGGRQRKPKAQKTGIRRVRNEPPTIDIVEVVDPVIAPAMTFLSVVGELRPPHPGATKREMDAHQKTGGLGFIPAKYRSWFAAAAEKFGLSARLLGFVGQQESGFNPKAVSPAGAQGVMQVMPLHGMEDPFNARKNIFKGAEILASYVNGLGILEGLAAYNAGPGNAPGQPGRDPDAWEQGLAYAREILRLLRGG